ncbi:UDP-N-acetylglucosamine 1-carboxyvinyltransferase [Patescibacteria group bacterium]|nr:UDP-N-acetylglucosamine 1-carboxyvinyltransferase [Patescibacteria group bacterium]
MNNRGLKQIGGLITKLREKRGITQRVLGKMIGTTQSAIARMENGEQNFSTEMLLKLSRALNKEIVSIATGAINLEIEGGKKLSGSITTNTSKNGAVVLLCASLLNRNITILKNIPRIEEVHRIIEVLLSIGVSVTWKGGDVEIKPPSRLTLSGINTQSATKTRSILLFIGPLIHLLKSFKLPQSGGCTLGARTVKPHFYALEKLGVKITTKTDHHRITRGELTANTIILYESGDTVTENALMAASKIAGVTIIKYASANYQVQELCFFLEKLGIVIEGIGTTTLTVHGKKVIDTPIEYPLSEDPIDSMFFLTAAIVTKSTLIIRRCPIDFLELELLKLEKMGLKYKIIRNYKALNKKTNLVDIKVYPSQLIALSEKIAPRPYPGLNMDNLPFFAVIATQAKGQTLIHDWVYEKRTIYFSELDKLGAETVLADPHRIYITGPTKLKSAELICPPALRPAAIILLGMLAAEGVSILRNIYTIERGYEDLAKRLNGLGARIRILQEFTS